jgi:O-antigen/teichoic acid export membrane protein
MKSVNKLNIQSITLKVKNLRLDSLMFVRKWASKGIAAVIDQALFSGSNFVVNILLARWLSPEEYGAFAVALSVFYLLAGFHTAVLTEPMMVFGARKYKKSFRNYLGMLLYGHWGLSGGIALLLSGVAVVMAGQGLGAMSRVLWGLAIASPLLLLLWLIRRGCYAQTRPEWAAVGSGVNLALVLAGLFLLLHVRLLSSLSGLVLLGVAAGVASLAIMLSHLRPCFWGFTKNPTLVMVLSDHWSYGRWIILEGIAYSISAQLWLVLVPLFLGLHASAALAAIWNLYRPISLFIQTIGLILLPTFANWISEGIRENDFQARVLKLAILFACAAGIYGFILTIVAEPLLHLLYKGKYDQYWLLVPLYGGATSFAVLVQNFIIAMKARMAVTRLPVIWGVAAATCVFVSVPLMLISGVTGAVTGYLLGYALASVIAYRMLRSVSS